MEVPEALAQTRRWVSWRHLAGKKPPCDGDGRPLSRWNDPGSWLSLEEAQSRVPPCDGVGFVIGDGWGGIDLDDCRDLATGEIDPRAEAVLRQCDGAYVEVSPSGLGLKVFGRAAGWAELNFKSAAVRAELKDTGYFCVTGQVYREGGVLTELPLAAVVGFFASEPPAEAKPKSKARLPEDGAAIPAGMQDQWLHSRAGRYRREGMGREEIVSHLRVDLLRCPAAGAPWTDADLERHADQVMKHEPAGLVLDPKDPYATATHYARGSSLLCQAGVFYRRDPAENCWPDLEKEVVRGEVWRMLSGASRVDPKHGTVPFSPSQHNVNEVMDAAAGIVVYPKRSAPPRYLDGRPAEPLVAFRNGLLRVEGRELLEPDPLWYNHTALPFDYDPAAPEPAEWLKFLESVWPGGGQEVGLLQEVVGYLLSGETGFQKVFMVVGPKRSGKGTIGRVLRQLLGARNVCGPTLESLEEPFGRECLIGKTMALIADARITGRAGAKVAEELLAISGEDPRSIQRKYLPAWEAQVAARFLILTNELPRIEDASGALASRFVIIKMTRSFYGREDLGLQARVDRELPGVLNWGLAGWDRLRARGHFEEPESSREIAREFEDLGSPIGTFLKERCAVGPKCEVERCAAWREWLDWCREQGRDYTGTLATFGRDLRAAVPDLGDGRHKDGDRRYRTWTGFGLLADDQKEMDI